MSTPSFADNCDQAAYFYKKGHYRSARTVLEPLLKKGEACAEYYMGRIYGRNVKTKQKGISLIESASTKGYPAAKEFMASYH